MGCKQSKQKNKVENQDDITPKIYLNENTYSSSIDLKSVSKYSDSERITSRRPSKGT